MKNLSPLIKELRSRGLDQDRYTLLNKILEEEKREQTQKDNMQQKTPAQILQDVLEKAQPVEATTQSRPENANQQTHQPEEGEGGRRNTNQPEEGEGGGRNRLAALMQSLRNFVNRVSSMRAFRRVAPMTDTRLPTAQQLSQQNSRQVT